MTRAVSPLTVFLALTILVTTGVEMVYAQDDEQDLGWFDTAELTVVSTSGNANSSTVGFKNELMRTWESSDLLIALGALHAGSTTLTRTAVMVVLFGLTMEHLYLKTVFLIVIMLEAAVVPSILVAIITLFEIPSGSEIVLLKRITLTILALVKVAMVHKVVQFGLILE